MRSSLLASLSVAAALTVAMPAGVGVLSAQDQAQARDQGRSRQTQDQPSQGRARPREEPPPKAGPAPQGRAQPRPPEQAPRERQQPRRPPPRVIPPRYYARPHVYYFPPISIQRGFYYHPYFGFYYGPYYGPFYPYPGPAYGVSVYSESAVRTRVKPVETEVYVNGYYAGLVDDFDGIFQRLYLPAGNQDLAFHLDGYETYRVKVYLSPGDTRDITHVMQPLRPGERSVAPSPEASLPDAWATPPDVPPGDRPASPYGVLALRLNPPDAEVLIDNEPWPDLSGHPELVVQVPAGWHHIEVRKPGYQPFTTDVELSESTTTRLGIVLKR